MTTSNPLKDADFEGWLASINQACGRFAAKTLGKDLVVRCRSFAPVLCV